MGALELLIPSGEPPSLLDSSHTPPVTAWIKAETQEVARQYMPPGTPANDNQYELPPTDSSKFSETMDFLTGKEEEKAIAKLVAHFQGKGCPNRNVPKSILENPNALERMISVLRDIVPDSDHQEPLKVFIDTVKEIKEDLLKTMNH